MEKKKIKICFAVRYAYPLFNKNCKVTHGGAEVQMTELGEKLRDRGYDISFLVGDFGQGAVEEYGGIKVYREHLINSKLHLIRGFWYFYQLVSLFLIRKIKADIYIINGAAPDVLPLAFFSFMLKSKFVFMTAHDMDVNGDYRIKSEKEGRFYEKGLRMADFIICQNQDQQMELEKKYHLASGFVSNSIKIPSESVLANEKKFVLWVARLDDWKQPEKCIEIAKCLPEIEFIMIGPPANDKEYAKKIQSGTQNISNLKYIEKVPYDQINEYFKKAKLFLNTSIHEGFPVTFLQSAIFGTPVLTLNVDPDGFLSKYECGFCAGGDEEKLISVVREYSNSESLWQEKSANILNYVKEHNDIEKNVDKFEKYIGEIIKENHEEKEN